MAFRKDSDSEPSHRCTLEREFPLQLNPPRRCEPFYCSLSFSVLRDVSATLTTPSPPRLPVSWLIIDYTAKAVIVRPWFWWVVWMKTELMESTWNALMVEELVGRWVNSSSSRDDQSICWWRLISNPQRTLTLPHANITHMSEGN